MGPIVRVADVTHARLADVLKTVTFGSPDRMPILFSLSSRQPQRGEIRKPRASEAKPWVNEQTCRKAPTGRDSFIPDVG